MKDENIELRTQSHLMDAEGSDDDRMTELQVKFEIRKRGYVASNIEIWFDTLMRFWRFSADIKPVNQGEVNK